MKAVLLSGFLITANLCRAAGVEADQWLLTGASEIEAAREKAERQPWARAAHEELLQRADEALQGPLSIPDRGGQWPHWYSCRRDGVRLKTISATKHRCPKCGTVYTGDPYDAVVLYWEHSRNSRSIRDLGLAYRFTGKAAYAERAKRILLAYAHHYSSYPLHDKDGKEEVGGGRIMAQTLDESVWLIPVAFGYALVRDTLSPEERRHIERDLFLPAAEVIRSHRMGIHNIQCWKNSAVGLAGLVAGSQELVREAIDDPDRGFRAQILRGVTDDGLWFEGSVGYHRYTMSALWPLAEAARRHGIDLYSDRYRSMYDAPLVLALPNGDAPGFNDNDGGNILSAAPLYELAYARWRRPEYGRLVARTKRDSIEALLYGVEELPAGPMIPENSILLRDAGYAVLRSPAMVAAVRFGMHGGGHGHPDKLNVVTYGASHQGGLDPGSINYGVPLHREWYRSTVAHNTVSADEGIQRPADGQLEEWSPETGMTKLVASADNVYPGVRLRRTLELNAEQMTDRFECVSDSEHIYDWVFHVPGRIVTDLVLSEASGPMGQANGYQHIRLHRRGRIDKDWGVTWEFGDARLILRMKGAPGTEIFVGTGPGREPAEPVSMIVVRRRATKTSFEAVHEFSKIQ